MNKSFVLFDRNNNLQKNATVVVKFNCDGKDYLIYCVDENEQNSQIFVSRLVVNSEGKYFIDNVLADEKGKLNNVVYNIVILVPSDAQKGSTYDVLISGLLEKFGAKLSSDIPALDTQEYYSNCSVAITSKILVEAAAKYYNDNLNAKVEDVVSVPTWTAPTEVTAPTPAPVSPTLEAIPSVSDVVQTVQPNVTVPVTPVVDAQVQPTNVVETPAPAVVPQPVVSAVVPEVSATVNNTTVSSVPTPAVTVQNPQVSVNPQAEKLAVVSDPSIGINTMQPNLGKNKEAGFANTKYIAIGTSCLVLAIGVVITAFILINNM